MFDTPEESPPSLVRRLLANPFRLRRRSLVVLAGATVLAGGSRFVDDWLDSLLTAIVWVGVLPIALGIAAGDAFLVAHGRGRKRLLWTLIGAALIALSSCVVLAGVTDASDNRGREIATGVAYGAFYAANVLGLSALVALAIGFGGDYVSRRIDAMSEDDW